MNDDGTDRISCWLLTAARSPDNEGIQRHNKGHRPSVVQIKPSLQQEEKYAEKFSITVSTLSARLVGTDRFVWVKWG